MFRETVWVISGLVLLFGMFAWGLEPSTQEANEATRVTGGTAGKGMRLAHMAVRGPVEQ